MDRDALLAKIEAAYAARIAGDKAALAAMCAAGAQFELAGEKGLIEGYAAGPGGFSQVVDQLINLVVFHEVRRRDAVVEDSRAAVHWDAVMSVAGGGPFATGLYDLWEFDRDGRIARLIQFADTARLAQELAKARG